MLRKKTILTSLAVAALAVSVGIAPAHGSEKNDGPGGQASDSVLPAEAAAAQAAPRAARGAEAALSALQANIGRWVAANGPKHTFASYLDATTGRIVLKTDAPGHVVASLVGTNAGLVDTSATDISDLATRKADTTPYWGGAGITKTTGTPWCSSGFTVVNAYGTRSMITAGHCFSNGTTVRTELGGLYMGTVSGNGLPYRDMERISGSSYAGRIYSGGTNSSTSLPVHGAGDPVVGYTNYCHSGRTTGENCGHKVISTSAQVCTSSGCKSPVIAFQNGFLPQGGDSGSPFYVGDSAGGVHIRGMIIAGDGTTEYAEKWSRISSNFAVSIVTG